jgi:hypothetical protein
VLSAIATAYAISLHCAANSGERMLHPAVELVQNLDKLKVLSNTKQSTKLLLNPEPASGFSMNHQMLEIHTAAAQLGGKSVRFDWRTTEVDAIRGGLLTERVQNLHPFPLGLGRGKAAKSSAFPSSTDGCSLT